MMNVTNLKLLADYLLALPEDYQHFDMGVFSDVDLLPIDVILSEQPSCNTAGCAVGHAPYVKGLPKPFDDESWWEYSERIFGMSWQDEDWEWCFDSDWGCVDNTPHGAAKRILQLISTGLPDSSSKQRYGVAPLSY